MTRELAVLQSREVAYRGQFVFGVAVATTLETATQAAEAGSGSSQMRRTPMT